VRHRRTGAGRSGQHRKVCAIQRRGARPSGRVVMIRRALDVLYWFAGVLAGLFLIAIFVLMMILSGGREVGFNLRAGDDIVSWCMAAMSFLGLAHTFRHGELIRVGLLIDRLAGRTRWFAEIAALALGCVFIGFFAWHAARMTWESYVFNEMAQGVLPVPLWFPRLGFSIGLAILFIAFLDEFIHVLKGGTPRYEKPRPTTAEEVVEQAAHTGV
jgi:TRAP-type C4-dicarboxylate transport system permease small subunit